MHVLVYLCPIFLQIEGALVRLFDEGAGTARTEDDEEQEEESERKSLWRRCCVAERLRSGEFMRRYVGSEGLPGYCY